jgi:hypothetical protein
MLEDVAEVKPNPLGKYPQDVRSMIVSYRKAIRQAEEEDKKAERLRRWLCGRGVDPSAALRDADAAMDVSLRG